MDEYVFNEEILCLLDLNDKYGGWIKHSFSLISWSMFKKP